MQRERRINPEKIRFDALRLLKIRPRSEWELSHRLELKGYSREDVSRVVENFREMGLLDDLKFARLFSTDEMELKCRGPKYIEYELRMLRIDEEIIGRVVDEVMKEADLKKLFDRFAKRYHSKTSGEIADKLIKRGFDPQTVRETLREISENWRCVDVPGTDDDNDSNAFDNTRSDTRVPEGKKNHTEGTEKREGKCE